jgi:hypothetical protein
MSVTVVTVVTTATPAVAPIANCIGFALNAFSAARSLV